MRHHSHLNDDKPQLAGIAVLAAAVGALTALILAPRSGSETRREIRNRLALTKADILTRLKAVKTVARDEAASATDTLSDAVTLGQEAVEETAKAAKRAARKAKTDNDDLTDHIRKNGEQ